jgi:hypothetical protein
MGKDTYNVCERNVGAMKGEGTETIYSEIIKENKEAIFEAIRKIQSGIVSKVNLNSKNGMILINEATIKGIKFLSVNVIPKEMLVKMTLE